MLKAIPRHNIDFSRLEFKAILETLFKGRIFKGDWVQRFEREFARYIGVKYAVLVCSGRLALFHIFKTLDYKPGDEIILSSYNYYVIPEVIRLCGLKPVFVDIELNFFNINTALIEKSITHKTRAIITTHMFGHPCDLQSIYKLNQKYNLDIIEDCAHSCGSEYNGIKTGALGRAALFSYSMPKALTTFRGGAVTTNDEAIYETIKKSNSNHNDNVEKMLYDFLFGLICYLFSNPYVFTFTSFPVLLFLKSFFPNFHKNLFFDRPRRLSIQSPNFHNQFANLKAALGFVQLNRLDVMTERRRVLSKLLLQELKDFKNISLPWESPNVKHNYLYFNILVDNKEQFSKKLYFKGIDTEIMDFHNCSDLEIFKEYYVNSPVSAYAQKHILRIPNFPKLKEEDIKYIAKSTQMVYNDNSL